MSFRDILVYAVAIALLALVVYLGRRKRVLKLELGEWTPSPAEAADLAAMQGTWQLVSTRRNGAIADGPACQYVFQGDTMLVVPEGKPASQYTIRLDGRHRPKKLMIFAQWESGELTGSESAYELKPGEIRWCHIGGQCPPAMLPDDSPTGTVIRLRRAT